MSRTKRINRTLLYGEGLFETLRVYPGRKVPLLKKHCRRMAEGAEFFGFPFSPPAFAEAAEWGLQQIPEEAEARLRVTLEVFGEKGPEETGFLTHSSALTVTDWNHQEGVRLISAPFSRSSCSPLLAFKTTNYFENSYARQWARRQGFYDALFFNERREITETTTANLLLVRGRTLVTPPVSAGLLPGIARHLLLLIAKEVGLSVEEHPITTADLQEAEEVLISNVVVEALPVREIAGVYTSRSPFDRTRSLWAAYRENILVWEKE
ncbi:MAG: aminotransferase class IV [Candidatus Methylomirabilales bacterium]